MGECQFSADLCPVLPVDWKGAKYSFLQYSAYDGFAIRINVPNNNPEFDIRENPYTGFMMISRRYCGVDFINGLFDGSVKMNLMARLMNLQFTNY